MGSSPSHDASWQQPIGSYVELSDSAFASYWSEWTDEGQPFEGVLPRRTPAWVARPNHVPFGVEAAKLLLGVLRGSSARPPRTYLEVGPGNGRHAWELLRVTPSVTRALLLEPTERLRAPLTQLLCVPGTLAFKAPFGGRDQWDVALPTTRTVEAVRHAEIEVVDRLVTPSAHDICVCHNVLDQVAAPNDLLSFVQACTAPGGLLAVSCTYQWQPKKLRDPSDAQWDIRRYFDAGWRIEAEGNLPYRLRVNERFHSEFRSHVLVVRAP